MMEFLSGIWDFICDAMYFIFRWIVIIALVYGFIRAFYDGIKRNNSFDDD